MRSTRLLTVALKQPAEATNRVEINRSAVINALRRAEPYNPDFVCLPEIVIQERAGGWFDTAKDIVKHRIDLAERVPGPSTEAVGEVAQELDTYVLLPLLELDSERVYNSTVLIDPDGEVVGSYHKLRPPLTELEPGITPGRNVEVWDTRYGRVGAAICFDLMYPEIGTAYARHDVDVVFFSSQFDGGERLKSWARFNGFYIVKSTADSAEIISPTGNVIAETRDGYPPRQIDLENGARAGFAFAEVNTDFGIYALSSCGEALPDIQQEHDVTVVDGDREGDFYLESRSPEVSVEDLEKEYGLETIQDYLDRTAAAIQEQQSETGPGLSSDLH